MEIPLGQQQIPVSKAAEARVIGAVGSIQDPVSQCSWAACDLRLVLSEGRSIVLATALHSLVSSLFPSLIL